MKTRKIRRWIVVGLAAAAVATGVFASGATSSASDYEWSMPVDRTVVR